MTQLLSDSEAIARVLVEHQDAPAENGGAVCICGNWSGPWTGGEFAFHVAARILAEARTS